jgi:hypothetical protein
MKFYVFRCNSDQDYFIVTDEAHESAVLEADLCPTKGDKIEKVGVFEEMGDTRVAFDENIAMNSIREHGFYRFEAKTFDPVAERPLPMP